MTEFSLEPPWRHPRWERCESVNHGCRCVLDVDHQGPHCAVWGTFMRWEGQGLPGQASEQASADVFWAAWALRMGVNATDMREEFFKLALESDFPPNRALLVLLEAMSRSTSHAPPAEVSYRALLNKAANLAQSVEAARADPGLDTFGHAVDQLDKLSGELCSAVRDLHELVR